jgi:steroid 5-alpha reductase family enzyme
VVISVFGILLVMSVIMTTGWFYQRAVQNGGWTDVFWTYGTGVTCAAAALWPIAGDAIGWRRVLVAGLVLLWSIRLGTYVALRVARGSEDVRYAAMRRNWKQHFQARMFWLLIVQAPITAILSIGVLFAAQRGGDEFRFLDGLGIAILVLSIGGETIADGQMKRFRANPKNQGKVCNKGLWGWSRHPNYFFESLGWIAYPIIAIDPSNRWTLLSLIAPALMFIVLRFGTGVPPLEAAMIKSKGLAYRRYQARVSAIFPLPPKRATTNQR